MAMSATGSEKPLKFIASSKGKKVLVFEGHIYHHSATRASNQSSYFKCSHRIKGCGASIIVKKYNSDNSSYASYVVSNPEHLNHLPDVEKIRKKEEKERKNLTEKPITDVDSEEFRNSKHHCLFCLQLLPEEYMKITTLENVLSSGQILRIPLDDPVKNSHAFDLLCSLLNVRWRKTLEGQNFDQCLCLPLCFKCQNLYQELNQVHHQIRELETILNARVKVIREIIGRTETENINENDEKTVKGHKGKQGTTQLELLGLDIFRRKVVDLGFARFGADTSTLSSAIESASKKRKTSTTRNSIVANTTVSIKSERCEVASENPETPDISQSPLKVKEEADTALSEILDDEYPDINWAEEDSYPRQHGTTSVEMKDPMTTIESEGSESDQELIRKYRRRSKRLVAGSRKIIDEETDEEYIPSADDCVDSDEDYQDNTISDKKENNSSDSDGSDFKVKPVPKRKVRYRKGSIYTAKSSSRSRSSFFKKAQSYKYNYNNSDKLKKVYTCHICDEGIRGHKNFMNHYKRDHPDERLFSCKFCKRRYNRIRDVVVHQINKHTFEKKFQCSICSRAFALASMLKVHMDHVHTEKKDKETFPCPKCEKEFATKTVLNNHLVAEHNEAPKQMLYAKSKRPVKYLTCNVCDAKLLGRGPFIQHYEEQHPGIKRYTCRFCGRHYPYIRECLRHQIRKHTKETPCQCSECPKAFPDEQMLAYHRQTRHPREDSVVYECPICPKKYPVRSSLTNHLASHREPSTSIIVCKLCSKAFRLMGSFVKHNRITHDNKAECTKPISNPTKEALEKAGISLSEFKWSKKCHLCLTPFATKLLVMKHFKESHPEHKGTLKTCRCGKIFNTYNKCLDHAIRTHMGEKVEKKLQCDQCPRKFRVLTELRTHARTHIPLEERKKTYICPVCGMGLSNPTTLSQHMKKHEERTEPYVCDICGKQYQWKRGLFEHTKNAHLKIRPHKCNYCEKSFPLPSILQKHLNMHTMEKTYKCEICNKVFPYSGSLSRHLREVHDASHEKGQTPRKKKGRQSSTHRKPVNTTNEVDTEAIKSTVSEFEGIPTNYLTPMYHDLEAGPSFRGAVSGVNSRSILKP